MLFNSYEFIFLFLPIVVLVYFFLGKKENKRLANIWLIFASLFFYSYWEIKFLPVLLGSMLFNYLVSGCILKYRKNKEQKPLKKKIFIAGIVCNVALLCYYKYMDFFIQNINMLGGNFELWHMILPLGISFFSITQMVYLVDCYEGVAKDHDFVSYALFVTFFPHLLAGPILYHKPMMKQFSNDELKTVNWENMSRGLTLFIIGLAKKVLIADTFMKMVTPGFAHPENLTFIEAWLVSLSYMLQLYFDFSGYSDMAVGVARMLNINIPINFNSPYKAKGMIDFWKRWHMSLTTAITNYLYTPIFMSFKNLSFGNAMLSTFIAMFIAGVWHGAGWTFIVFGCMHGLGLVVNHCWKQYHLPMNVTLGRLVTLLWCLLAFVFFRAANVQDAGNMIYAMGNVGNIALPSGGTWMKYLGFLANYGVDFVSWTFPMSMLKIAVYIVVAFAGLFILPNSNEMVKKFQPNKKWFVAVYILFAISVISIMSAASEFLYFQF